MATTDATHPSAGSAFEDPIEIPDKGSIDDESDNDDDINDDPQSPLIDKLLSKNGLDSEASAAQADGVLAPASLRDRPSPKSHGRSPSPRPTDQPFVEGPLMTDDDTIAAGFRGATSSTGSQPPASVASNVPLPELHSAEVAVHDSEQSTSVAPPPVLAASELLAGVQRADRQPTKKKRKAQGGEKDTAGDRGQPNRKRRAPAQLTDGQGEWVVNRILGHRACNGGYEVLVQWRDTWEPLQALKETAALEDYQAGHGQLEGAAGQM